MDALDAEQGQSSSKERDGQSIHEKSPINSMESPDFPQQSFGNAQITDEGAAQVLMNYRRSSISSLPNSVILDQAIPMESTPSPQVDVTQPPQPPPRKTLKKPKQPAETLKTEQEMAPTPPARSQKPKNKFVFHSMTPQSMQQILHYDDQPAKRKPSTTPTIVLAPPSPIPPQESKSPRLKSEPLLASPPKEDLIVTAIPAVAPPVGLGLTNMDTSTLDRASSVSSSHGSSSTNQGTLHRTSTILSGSTLPTRASSVDSNSPVLQPPPVAISPQLSAQLANMAVQPKKFSFVNVTSDVTAKLVTEYGQEMGVHYKQKRKTITPEQTLALNEAFKKSDKPSQQERDDLAVKLGMSSREVQVWFQNRRAKQRSLEGKPERVASIHEAPQRNNSSRSIESSASGSLSARTSLSSSGSSGMHYVPEHPRPRSRRESTASNASLNMDVLASPSLPLTSSANPHVYIAANPPEARSGVDLLAMVALDTLNPELHRSTSTASTLSVQSNHSRWNSVGSTADAMEGIVLEDDVKAMKRSWSVRAAPVLSSSPSDDAPIKRSHSSRTERSLQPLTSQDTLPTLDK